jgi:tRNA U38,U39,U40 pseudouridine synthase TruA
VIIASPLSSFYNLVLISFPHSLRLLATQSVTDEARELDFMTLINKSLPETIQVLGWAPADPSFDARFR